MQVHVLFFCHMIEGFGAVLCHFVGPSTIRIIMHASNKRSGTCSLYGQSWYEKTTKIGNTIFLLILWQWKDLVLLHNYCGICVESVSFVLRIHKFYLEANIMHSKRMQFMHEATPVATIRTALIATSRRTRTTTGRGARTRAVASWGSAGTGSSRHKENISYLIIIDNGHICATIEYGKFS